MSSSETFLMQVRIIRLKSIKKLGQECTQLGRGSPRRGW